MKILYVLGVLEPIPNIMKAIEPVRDVENISRTPMKNEHAYYTTIAQTMEPPRQVTNPRLSTAPEPARPARVTTPA